MCKRIHVRCQQIYLSFFVFRSSAPNSQIWICPIGIRNVPADRPSRKPRTEGKGADHFGRDRIDPQQSRPKRRKKHSEKKGAIKLQEEIKIC